MTRRDLRADREESIAFLRQQLPRGVRLFFVLRKRHASGSVDFDIYHLVPDADMPHRPIKLRFTYRVAAALGLRYVERGEVIRSPYINMDVAHEVTYNLTRALWGEGLPITDQIDGEWM